MLDKTIFRMQMSACLELLNRSTEITYGLTLCTAARKERSKPNQQIRCTSVCTCFRSQNSL
jgi:hypothetical protein